MKYVLLFIKRKGLSYGFILVALVLLLSPEAKSWLLGKLVVTGLFNAPASKGQMNASVIKAGDFYFSDTTNMVHNISSLQGKVVFVNFWASWCPPCRAEFPTIERLYAKFQQDPDVFFLVVNMDRQIAAGKQFLKNEKYEIPFYVARGEIPKVLFSGSLPTTVLIDKNGHIRMQHEGMANYGSETFISQLETLMQE